MDIRNLPPPAAGSRAAFALTPSLAAKAAVSLGLGAMGMYYLWRGKEGADFEKMILGAALIIASLFVF